MKAPPFDYARPRSLAEAHTLLAQPGAKALAGGQTLLATLNVRLSSPSLLVDLGGLNALRGITVAGNQLRIGALSTHSQIEASALVAQHAPLLALAVPHIAHRAIRNRGTIGGSVAYADPAAELPACLLALDATVLASSPRGERRIAALDFFVSLFQTALADDEIITACELPLHRSGDIVAFDELARRQGDYAVVGLAFAACREGSRLRAPRLAFLSCGPTPLRAKAAEALLDGQVPDAALLDRMAHTLASELEPSDDLTHTAATKRHLASVLARRVLQRCWGALA